MPLPAGKVPVSFLWHFPQSSPTCFPVRGYFVVEVVEAEGTANFATSTLWQLAQFVPTCPRCGSLWQVAQSRGIPLNFRTGTVRPAPRETEPAAASAP